MFLPLDYYSVKCGEGQLPPQGPFLAVDQIKQIQKEIHDIRVQLYEETKNMTLEERMHYAHSPPKFGNFYLFFFPLFCYTFNLRRVICRKLRP